MKWFAGVLFFVSLAANGADENVKIIYKYKKYQKIDLGNLSVKGKILTPGDISVKKERRKKFHMGLYFKKDFDREMAEDMRDFR